MIKVTKATERNIKQLSTLKPGDIVRIYKTSCGRPRPFSKVEKYDTAVVGNRGFTYEDSIDGMYDGTPTSARLHLVITGEYGITETDIRLSNNILAKGKIVYKETAQIDWLFGPEKTNSSWPFSLRRCHYYIAIEVPTKEESK